MDDLENDFDRAEFLTKTLIGHATQDECGGTDNDYIFLRKYFFDNPITKKVYYPAG